MSPRSRRAPRTLRAALAASLALFLITTGATAASAADDPAADAPGTISGTLTRPDGTPAAGSIEAYGVGGHALARAEADGTYQLSVAPGVYTVQFSPDDPSLAREYWEHAPTGTPATPVTVAAGGTVEHIDARFQAYGYISGTVRSGGAPLGGVVVEAWSEGARAAMAWTKADGSYRIEVVSGAYTVFTSGDTDSPGPEYFTQYFDHVADEADAAPVTAVAGDDRAGVDFDLIRVPNLLTIAPGSVLPGGTVQVSGKGFAAAGVVTITLHSTPVVLGTVQPDRSGAFTTTVTIPADTTPGDHVLVATAAFGLEAGGPLTVLSPVAPGGSGGAPSTGSATGSGQLAATGADVTPSLAVAAVLLVVGGSLLRGRRVLRRR